MWQIQKLNKFLTCEEKFEKCYSNTKYMYLNSFLIILSSVV